MAEPSAIPFLLELPSFGTHSEGFITVAEMEHVIPFPIARAFWTIGTPVTVQRGGHAHHRTCMVIIALQGVITVETTMLYGGTKTHILDDPNVGLYLPIYCWHTLRYSPNSIQLVFASTLYEEEDYIRNFQDFRSLGS
jgi:hypothetical protein